MKKTGKATIVIVSLFLVAGWIIGAAGLTTVLSTDGLGVLGMAILPSAIVTGLLIGYFTWRTRVLDRILGEHKEHRKAA